MLAKVGVTNAEGVFTRLSVPDKYKGAVIGKHCIRIVVQRSETDGTDKDAATVLKNATVAFRQLPERYNDSTELTCEVPTKGTTTANFELTWK